MSNSVTYNVKLPEELHRQAKVASAIRGEPLSGVVRKTFESYVQTAVKDGILSSQEILKKEVE